MNNQQLYTDKKTELRTAIIARNNATNVKKWQQGQRTVRELRSELTDIRATIDTYGPDSWWCPGCDKYHDDSEESIDGLCDSCADEEEDW